MKKGFAVFVALVVMPLAPANAWVGGPFGNNSGLSQGDDGVYEAVAICSNGMGLYRFGVRNNPGTTTGTVQTSSSNVEFNAGLLTGRSSNIWYYRGISFFGTCLGSVNSTMGSVAVVGNAAATSNGNSPVISPSPPIVAGAAVTPPGTGIVINTPSTTGFSNTSNTIINPAGGNVGFANSNFLAKLGPKGRVRTFKGSGVISFVGNSLDTETHTIQRVETIVNGTVTTTITSERAYGAGENENFSQRGHKRKFRVSGSQVSTTASAF